MRLQAGSVLALVLVLAPLAAAESGTIVLSPGERHEVEIHHRQYQRIAYAFNTTPETLAVGWNIHYIKQGGLLYERAPENATQFESTFFPLRAGPYFLQFRNWDEDETVRVAYAWEPTVPVSSTRQAPGPEPPALLAVVLLAALAAAGRRRIGRV